MHVGKFGTSGGFPGKDDHDKQQGKKDRARLKAIHQLLTDLDGHETQEFMATAHNHGNDEAPKEFSEKDSSLPDDIDVEELKRRLGAHGG